MKAVHSIELLVLVPETPKRTYEVAAMKTNGRIAAGVLRPPVTFTNLDALLAEPKPQEKTKSAE